MDKLPAYARNFASFDVCEVLYHTEQGEQTLLWESRITPDEETIIFTVLDGQEVRVSSVNELVKNHPQCLSLSIPHNYVEQCAKSC